MDVAICVVLSVGSICFIIQAIYETHLFKALRDMDTRRNYYPLQVNHCARYKVIKEPDGFNIQNNDSSLHYKLLMSKKHCFTQDWKLVDQNNPRAEEVATIHKVNKYWLFGKEYIHFPLIRNPSEPLTAVTSLLSDHCIPDQVSSPYIDLSLQQNYVRQRDLGLTVRMLKDIELKKKETRKLHTLILHKESGSNVSCFRIAKDSMEYKWELNGYLEKTSKNKVFADTERIGFIRFDGKGQYTVYLNENRIDSLLGIATSTVELLNI